MKRIKTSKLKESQYNNADLSQYESLLDHAEGIAITGSGQGEAISIPGAGKTISARELLNNVKSRILPLLIQNGVKEIDTSPISDPQAQGLAISHEPGKIHIDVSKIFNQARNSLPPTSQLDGVQADPNVVNGILDHISQLIEAELTETAAHEAQHVSDYQSAYTEGNPFTSVQEHPAEQEGKRVRQQYHPNI